LESVSTGDVASSYRGGDGGAVALFTQSSKIFKKRSTVAPPVVEDRNGPRHDDIDANAVVLCAASDAPISTIFGRQIMEVWYPQNLERMIITKNGRTTKHTVSKARTKALKN
jgi:hypothetical protein